LRRRAGTLLLATTGVSGDSAGEVHGRWHSAWVPDREVVRAALHSIVRAPGFDFRCVAGSATPCPDSRGSG